MLQHPDWDQKPGILTNDITIIQTAIPIGGANIAPGRIPSETSYPGGPAWISGWGRPCCKIFAFVYGFIYHFVHLDI